MRITAIKNNGYFRSPSFKRAPDSKKVMPDGRTEEKFYSDTIQEAKNYLDIKNLAVILHQSSFPVKDNDIFIGSHIGEKAKEVNEFFRLHGFDSIQLGPPGLTELSPYNSCINSKNYVYTDFEALSKTEYASILPDYELKNLLNSIDKKRKYESKSDQTRFKGAFYVADRLYSIAYKNFKTKLETNDESAQRLNREFLEYKAKQGDWLENDALFEYFKKKYRMNEIFFEWPELDRNLIKYKNDKTSPMHNEAINYIEKIKNNHKDDIELYKFKQFIIDKQEKDFNINVSNKLNYITDAIIGFSWADYYSNQDAFLKDYRIGTPYGGEGRSIGGGSIWGENQTWEIPVLNPQKLFIRDNNGNITGLGIAGQLLKNKFSSLLENNQNIRIDHAIGLIDPWIYNQENLEIRRGRYPNEPYDTPEHIVYKNAHGANISIMGKDNAYNPFSTGWDWHITEEINKEIKNMPDVDPNGDYAKIPDLILLPLLKDKGININDVVWESLGCNTPKFDEVYKNPKRPLPDISSSYQYQLEHRPKTDWFMIGCHDHGPFAQVCTDDFYQSKCGIKDIMNPSYLIGCLYPDLSNSDKQKLVDDMYWDRRLRVKTKYQELLRFGQKIQFTFMDFFGLDKTYNAGGTQNENNWKLRLKKSYKEDYYKALEWQPGDSGVFNIPVNMPESLRRAVISKIIMTGDKLQNHQKLLDNLNYCDKKILKQKS